MTTQSTYAKQGMVVAPHAAAAESGCAVLREGGNALEAMVAAAATISVVYPHMNGIGGDSFWLVHEPGRDVITIDACGRPYWVYTADWPQTHAGTFDLSLVREFVIAFTNRAQVNLHAHCRYGSNGHHMVEALFKALGKALAQAYAPRDGGAAAMSTKGVI